MGAELLAGALRRSGHFAGVAVATGAADAKALLANQPFDVLLVNSKFEGDEGGLKLARESCELHPRAKVVMLLESSERESVVQAFRAGCQGVFCHTQSVKELTKCLVCVHRGQIWATSRELNYVVEALREPGLFG